MVWLKELSNDPCIIRQKKIFLKEVKVLSCGTGHSNLEAFRHNAGSAGGFWKDLLSEDGVRIELSIDLLTLCVCFVVVIYQFMSPYDLLTKHAAIKILMKD